MMGRNGIGRQRRWLGAFLAVAIAGIGGDRASAQTYGFATLPPGTLNHTTASAISKIMKEKGGVNMLVQPTAGDQVINPAGRARRGRDRHHQHHGGDRTRSMAG